MALNQLRPTMRLAHIAAAVLGTLAASAHAMQIDTGNEDLAVRWDTTIKYSAAARVEKQNPIYLGPANANGDDGDRNFGRGLVSNRLDLFTEADVTWRNQFGARVSGAAFYDEVYNKANDNPGFAGGAFPNVDPPFNRFSEGARREMGRKGELLDAFVFGKMTLGDTPVTFRLGQHGMTWGESLFFGGNAIAGGMMPVDAIKLAYVPATTFKEAIRPVPMVSGTVLLSSTMSLGAYYQFRWDNTLLPPAGSYLSTADVLGAGADRLLAGPITARRLGDREPKDSGQGGLQLRFRGSDTDYGLYLIRYHEKTPQLVPLLAPNPGPGPAFFPANYYLAYNQGVTAFAATASRTFGDYNLATEVGVRRNASLASTRGADLSLVGLPATDVSGNPGYATGKTAHVNISMLASLPENALWREASLTAEVAYNRLLSVMKNPSAVDPNASRDGFAARVAFEPTYRNVGLAGVDVGVPFTVGWAPKGSRPVGAGGPGLFPPENGGDMSIGLNVAYKEDWRFTLNYTHYFGGAQVGTDATGAYNWRQTLADRDFVAASVRYAF